jgi:hypothetical protein
LEFEMQMGIVDVETCAILSPNSVSQAIWHDSLINYRLTATGVIREDHAHPKFEQFFRQGDRWGGNQWGAGEDFRRGRGWFIPLDFIKWMAHRLGRGIAGIASCGNHVLVLQIIFVQN